MASPSQRTGTGVIMRIAMLPPITHPFPPPGYGPWERVAFNLTEALVAAGHDVTVFAPAGSLTTAHLHPTVPEPMIQSALDPRLAEEEHLDVAFEHIAAADFDVVHSHLHVHALGYGQFVSTPIVTTLHGVAWNTATHRLLRRYADRPFVSISNAERAFLPELRYVATVPNGIRMHEFDVGDGAAGHLAFVGRIAPEKALDLAIATARRSGRSLHIAGPVEAKYRAYFECEIEPHLDGSNIVYHGELDRARVARLVGDSVGLLMPLRWDEPFGLVVVESLAAGTPVIAWRRGAMPEIVAHERTGFLVDDVAGAVTAIGRLDEISRLECHRSAQQRFSAETMAAGYMRVYEELLVTPSQPGRLRRAL